MKILGIDPGTRVTGYGIVENKENRLIHIDNGGIFTDAGAPLPERLKEIYTGLGKIIEEYRPDVISMEDIFYSKNVKSALKLGHARGVSILAGSIKDIEIFEYSPTAIKSAITGYGRAGKEQIQRMVKVLLNLPEVPQSDAADALAAAICHINTAGTRNRFSPHGNNRR